MLPYYVLLYAVVSADAISVGAQLRAARLGDFCRSGSDCAAANARCQAGLCACQPYYARANDTACLESVLLGSDCRVSEQCSLKVANSACLDSACRCTEGYLQFRKHTCLGPAQPGQVCYSNEHCRLWDSESHCEFVIPNLFGRCACNSFFRQINNKCIDQTPPSYNIVTEAIVAEEDSVVVEPSPGTAPQEVNNIILKPPITLNPGSEGFNPPSKAEDVMPPVKRLTSASKQETISDEDSPLMQAVLKVPTVVPLKRIPLANRKNGDPNEAVKLDELTASLHANDQPIYRVVTQPTVDKNNKNPIQNFVTAPEKPSGPGKPHKTTHQKKSSLKEKHRTRIETMLLEDRGPVSLGMACLTDAQCQRGDEHSRCVNKRCDCAYRTNTTTACSARNRGCLPGTFQCRSTGNCISWYFVCDGRKDCPDGSDEKCEGTGQDGSGERCPMHAFRCGGQGSPCVSRAARCDGKQQCPGGEDERNCKATRRKGCPRHTFRCGSGECLPEYEFCNAVMSCKDGSDEPRHLCNEQSRWRAADVCPLRCGNGRCRSTAVACSGRDGCGDNSDEIACSVCKCPASPLQ